MAWYDTDWSSILVAGEYGWFGQLLPLLLVLGISWALSRKAKEIMFIQLPLCLGMKWVFPFFNVNFIIISVAIFVMNIFASKGDIIGDIKNAAIKISEVSTPQSIKAKLEARKLDSKASFEHMVENMRAKISRPKYK